jgi:hypothetical protein
MPAGIVTRNLNPLAFRPGLRSEFYDSYKQYQEQWSFFLKSEKRDKPEIEMATVRGLNRLYQVGDGEAVSFDTIEMGRKAAAVDREFKAGYGVTLRAIEDDFYGKLNTGARHLGNAARLTMEYQAAGLLDGAISTATFAGEDGLALLSTAHTLMGSATTVANRPTTEVGFSIAGVTNLMDLAGKCKDQNGDPIVVNLSKCIIPNDQGVIQDAWKIFGMEKEPFTANNDDNAIKGQLGKIQYQVNRYMTSTTRYFMIDPSLNDAHLDIRSPLSLKDWYDEDTDTQKVRARMRLFLYFYNWRGWYGAVPS